MVKERKCITMVRIRILFTVTIYFVIICSIKNFCFVKSSCCRGRGRCRCCSVLFFVFMAMEGALFASLCIAHQQHGNGNGNVDRQRTLNAQYINKNSSFARLPAFLITLQYTDCAQSVCKENINFFVLLLFFFSFACCRFFVRLNKNIII